MDAVLSVAFIIAATQFFKAKLGLKDVTALGLSFLVSLIVGLSPVAAEKLPEFAPWLDATIRVIALFIGAAGSYELVSAMADKSAGEG